MSDTQEEIGLGSLVAVDFHHSSPEAVRTAAETAVDSVDSIFVAASASPPFVAFELLPDAVAPAQVSSG